MSKLSRDIDAEILEEAARVVSESWFLMNIASDERNAKLMHDWLLRRAQWLRDGVSTQRAAVGSQTEETP